MSENLGMTQLISQYFRAAKDDYVPRFSTKLGPIMRSQKIVVTSW